MGRVHVHQHHAALVLRQDVDAVDLGQGHAQRVFLVGGQGGRVAQRRVRGAASSFSGRYSDCQSAAGMPAGSACRRNGTCVCGRCGAGEDAGRRARRCRCWCSPGARMTAARRDPMRASRMRAYRRRAYRRRAYRRRAYRRRACRRRTRPRPAHATRPARHPRRETDAFRAASVALAPASCAGRAPGSASWACGVTADAPPVCASVWPTACETKRCTAPLSRKRTSCLAGWTLTSTAAGSMSRNST